MAVVDIKAVNGLVISRRSVIVGADICHLSGVVYQVDVLIFIGHHQAMCHLVVGNVCDIAVAKTINLIEGTHTLVFRVIGIKAVTGTNIEQSCIGLHNLLWRIIR